MLRLRDLTLVTRREVLAAIPRGKVLINTVNAFSYTIAQRDAAFAEALRGGDYLLPDGAGIVKACRWLGMPSQPKERIAGWDFFEFEMRRLNTDAPVHGTRPVAMFVGSSERTLALIKERAAKDFPSLDITTYSPPYKAEFSAADDEAIITAINTVRPDLLWIGMTAPKQEKWAYANWKKLDVDCHVGTIGAVFDFYAGTRHRAPLWWQRHSLEWLYRLIREPRRMWRRYIIGNARFLWLIMRER